MIRTLACALIAVVGPSDPPDGQAAPPPEHGPLKFVVAAPADSPDGQAASSSESGAFDDVITFRSPEWGQQRIGVVTWDEWSRGNPSRGLALATLDAATRAQLKVPEGRGLVATGLEEAGPAWKAGLRDDDILLSLDDEPLAEPGDLERLLKKAGEKPAALHLIRKAKPTTIRVQARIRAELGPVEGPPPESWIGASVSAVAPTLRAQLDIPDDRGLAVTGLADGSPAAAAGLRGGDVILAVDGVPIADPAALRDRVARSEGGPLTLEFLRAGEKASLKVTPTKRPDQAAEPVAAEFRNYTFMDVARAGVILRNDVVEVPVEQLQPAGSQPAAPAADAPKLDALAAEVKALREAVESLRKAVEGKE